MSALGSDAISDSKRLGVKRRDQGRCVVCGIDETEVAHILDRRPSWDFETESMMRISPQLDDFRKDAYENLILLCPTHRKEYDTGRFVLLPSPADLFEEEDFAKRQEDANNNRPIKPRSLPSALTNHGIEYIPVIVHLRRMYTHMPTIWEADTYTFDNQNTHPHPVFNYNHVSPYALMWESVRYIGHPLRYTGNKRANVAIAEVLALIALYLRNPQLPSQSSIGPTPAAVTTTGVNPSNPSPHLAQEDDAASGESNRPPMPTQHYTTNQMQHQRCGSESTCLSETGILHDADIKDIAGAELSAYRDEPSVSPEDLDRRLPLHVGKPLGRWWEYALHGY